MPDYLPIWLEIARGQYDELSVEVRELVDRRLEQLLRDPVGDRSAVYDERSDQWSVPLGELGFLVYAVVRAPPRVIVLRVVAVLA